MLYDPKWERKIKVDPFSLENLIAWLEGQPTTTTYCYLDHGRCLLGQYFSAHGFEEVQVIGRLNKTGAHITTGGKKHPYPGEWDVLAIGHPRTFGGALQRARKLLA